METSLHRKLKEIYAGDPDQTEVTLGTFRIDAIRDEELIEIQFASLGAIRKKIKELLCKHDVRVVKPIVKRKQIIRQETAEGPVLTRRLSPKRGEILDLFADLVYFTTVFPHRRLTIEVPIVNVEHWRLPPKPKRRKRWRRKGDFQTKDVVLSEIESKHEFSTSEDLFRLVGGEELPCPFSTADLAAHLGRSRDTAQQIAYCLRETGAVKLCGKQGNALLYEAA